MSTSKPNLQKPKSGKNWCFQIVVLEKTLEMVDGITNSMDMSLSELRETMKDNEVRHAANHEISRSGTQLSDLTTTTNLERK